MLVEHLVKTANTLDSVGTEVALQAAAGIDAALQHISKHAEDEVLTFYRDLQSLRQNMESLSVRAEELGIGPSVKNLSGYLSKMQGALKYLEGAIAANPDLDIKGRLRQAHPGFDEEADTKVDIQMPAGMRPAIEGDPSEWNSKPPPYISESALLHTLSKVATIFDEAGLVEAADVLDTIVKDAAELPKYPSRMETRQELYDAPANNRETMWEITQKEIAENRKEHHLETMRPHAESLSTRYSPELPGVPALRVSDGVYQDYLTKEVYDFNNGWTGSDGRKYPGGSLKHQTPAFSQYVNPSRLFDSQVSLTKRRS